MGKGGYHGGSTLIGPGSAWFSQGKAKKGKSPSTSLAKSRPTTPANAKPARPPKRKPEPKSAFLMSPDEAQKRGLTRSEWLARINKHIAEVEDEVSRTRGHLRKLERQLKNARDAFDRAKQSEKLTKRSPGKNGHIKEGQL